MIRIYSTLILSIFALLLSAQLPFGSHLDHYEMIQKGYEHKEGFIKVFDPEAKVLRTGSNSLEIIQADYYQHETILIIAVNGIVVNNFLSSNFRLNENQDRDSCVPGPDNDVAWVSGTFEDAVNAAIEDERVDFSEPDIGDYVHPVYANLYELSERVIEGLRTAYSAGYPDLDELTIETDLTLNDISQDFCCTMDVCNEFNHQSDCLGQLSDRVEAGIGTNFCWTSISENIGATWGYTDEETAVLHTLYNMMYYDVSCCFNSHREAILNCNFTANTKLGFGIHFTVDDDPYDLVMAWDFVTFTYNSGCTSDTPIGTDVCQSLPLEWQQISSVVESCDKTVLSWETVNELNMDRFEILRATKSIPFSKIGSIQAKNQLTLNHYSFVDHNLTTEPVFYRIKSIDQNGLSSFSSIIQVLNDCSNPVNIHPNPVQELLWIDFQDAIQIVEIFDLTGKSIARFRDASSPFNLSELDSGIYLLKIASESKTVFHKLIKE